MRSAFALVFRPLGYAGLAFVLLAAATLTVIGNTDICPIFTETQVACVTPLWQHLGEFTMAAIRITGATGLPLLLAIIGAIYLIIDFRRWRRRRGRLPAGPVEDRP